MMWVDIFQNPLSMAIKFKSQVAKNNQKKLIKGKKNRIENTTSVILLGDLHPDSTPIFFLSRAGGTSMQKLRAPCTHRIRMTAPDEEPHLVVYNLDSEMRNVRMSMFGIKYENYVPG